MTGKQSIEILDHPEWYEPHELENAIRSLEKIADKYERIEQRKLLGR